MSDEYMISRDGAGVVDVGNGTVEAPASAPEWFNGEPTLTEEVLVPVRERWLCPTEDCDGEMIFNGFTWPTFEPGHHHTCTVCGSTLAMRGKTFPRINYRPA